MNHAERVPVSLEVGSRLLALRERVEAGYPPSRERSLALTKLEEAGHWLTAAPRPEGEP